MAGQRANGLRRRVRSGSFSARFSPAVLERIEAHGRRTGESRARIAERLIDEGLRAEEFPGIVFRSGPTGRRAGLAAGPDVWEIVRDLKAAALAGAADPLRVVSEATGVPSHRLELAAGYYAAYPEDVDERIRQNEEAANRLRQALGIQHTA